MKIDLSGKLAIVSGSTAGWNTTSFQPAHPLPICTRGPKPPDPLPGYRFSAPVLMFTWKSDAWLAAVVSTSAAASAKDFLRMFFMGVLLVLGFGFVVVGLTFIGLGITGSRC